MKLLSILAVALVACTDLTSAWRIDVYRSGSLTGTKSHKSGKALGTRCHKISQFSGPNLAGKVGSIKFKSYDTKAKTVCSAAFYSSSNCKAGRGDGFDGYGTFSTSGSQPERYYSARTSCRRLNMKRSEIGDEGEWNATASALEGIDQAGLEHLENMEDVEDLEEREVPEEDEMETDEEEEVEEDEAETTGEEAVEGDKAEKNVEEAVEK